MLIRDFSTLTSVVISGSPYWPIWSFFFIVGDTNTVFLLLPAIHWIESVFSFYLTSRSIVRLGQRLLGHSLHLICLVLAHLLQQLLLLWWWVKVLEIARHIASPYFYVKSKLDLTWLSRETPTLGFAFGGSSNTAWLWYICSADLVVIHSAGQRCIHNAITWDKNMEQWKNLTCLVRGVPDLMLAWMRINFQ